MAAAADPTSTDPVKPPLLSPYTDFPYAVLPFPLDVLSSTNGVTPLQGVLSGNGQPSALDQTGHFEP